MNGTPGRILALDFGLRRVGAAISDPLRRIASPLEVYPRRTLAQDAEHYRRLIAEQQVVRIVVGLPLHTSGEEGRLAGEARRFGAWLEQATGRPVVFFDERFTTREAEERMHSLGLRGKDRQALRDMMAAQVLLRDYLAAGSPESPPPAGPLADNEPGTGP